MYAMVACTIVVVACKKFHLCLTLLLPYTDILDLRENEFVGASMPSEIGRLVNLGTFLCWISFTNG